VEDDTWGVGNERMGSNLTADIIGGRQGLVLLQAAVKAIE